MDVKDFYSVSHANSPALRGFFFVRHLAASKTWQREKVRSLGFGGVPITGRLSARRLSAVPPRNGLCSSSAASSEASSGKASYAWIFVLFSVCRISDKLEDHIQGTHCGFAELADGIKRHLY